MIGDRTPLSILTKSWDDVVFTDMADVIRRRVPRTQASTALDLLGRSASAWHGRTPSSSAAPRLSDEERRALRADFLRARNAVLKDLKVALAPLETATLFAAIAALGGVQNLAERGQFTIPGAFDREIDVLFESLEVQSDATPGRPPTWLEIAEVTTMAREVLVLETLLPPATFDGATRVRLRTKVAPYLGATYGPISSDLTLRAVRALQAAGHQVGPQLTEFDHDAQRIVAAWAKALAEAVHETTRDGSLAAPIASALLRTFTPSSLVDRVELDAQTTGVLTVAPVGPGRRGTTPTLMARGRKSVLVVPRSLVTDRHETFDRIAESILVPDPGARGNYSDVRAATLDRMIVDSLERLLPGAEIFLNVTVTIEGTRYEQDVVAFWNGIAICVETKAQRVDPHQDGGRTSVLSALRSDVAKGAAQAVRIARSIRDGTATFDGRTRSATRSYALVATFSSWWGVDADGAALVEIGTLPSLDAALLTSADKFAVYERVFENGEDFIAYLDHRRSLQRRPFVHVSDEYEMLGGYYTNPSNAPLLPRPGGTLVKDAFQDDVTETVHASFSGNARRSRWLRHDAAPFIDHHIRLLRDSRPPGWVACYSALRRMSVASQRMVDSEIARVTAAGRAVRTDDRERTVVVSVNRAESLDPQLWRNVERRAIGQLVLIAVRTGDGAVLAVRGVDDEETWFAPGVREMVTEVPRSADERRARTGQRAQPRRLGKRQR